MSQESQGMQEGGKQRSFEERKAEIQQKLLSAAYQAIDSVKWETERNKQLNRGWYESIIMERQTMFGKPEIVIEGSTLMDSAETLYAHERQRVKDEETQSGGPFDLGEAVDSADVKKNTAPIIQSMKAILAGQI